MHVSRKLCINMEVSSFLRSTPSPEYPQRSLREHAWFLTGVDICLMSGEDVAMKHCVTD